MKNFNMRPLLALALASTLFSSIAPIESAALQPPEIQRPNAPMACEADGTQASGAKYRICLPPTFLWNKDLIVFAHGYVDPFTPVGIPENQLSLGGNSVPAAANALGYAFAVSSYSRNGLAVREGISDTIDLVRIFREKYPTTNRVYLVGVSEGGLIATLLAERHPESFSGALAMCGPIGDFNTQVNHFGDFRAGFDYFYPGILPSSPISIPQTLISNWNTVFTNTVLPAISSPAGVLSLTQLFSTTQTPVDATQPLSSMIASTYGLLWYNVFSTNDGLQVLGGSPYGNRNRVYTGTLNDAAFNQGIVRFDASPAALANIGALQTRGEPKIPLVTLHTVGDEIVPYRHLAQFAAKIRLNKRDAFFEARTSPSLGHCNFTLAEVQGALNALQSRVSNPPQEPVITKTLLLPLVTRPG